MRHIAIVMATMMSSSIWAQPNLLDSGRGDWTAMWKPGYGCRVDTKLDAHPVLSQSLPPDFEKGNHSWSQFITVSPGAKYRFDVQYQLKDVGKALAQFHFAYPNGELMDYLNFRLSTEKLSGTQDNWQPLSFEFTAPAGAGKVQVALRLNSPGTVYWNAPTVTLISPTSDVRFTENDSTYDLRDSVGVVARQLPLNEIKKLNVKWFRCNINWASVEGEGKNRWNEAHLSKVENDIRAAKNAGLNVLVSLGYAPRWAARKTDGVRAGHLVAKDLQEWKQFVAVIVGRLGDSVNDYRIMNEVNHQWDTGSQPHEYAEFLKEAYITIKAIRPSARVVMAGLSGTPGGYLQEMLNAGAETSFDVAACQPYIQGRMGPEEGHLVDRLRAYRMVLAENNAPQPIWGTEFGYPSEPLAGITPTEQAALYVRSHLLAISSGAGVTKFFLFLLKDQDGDSISQTGGLFTKDWELKPLGEAVATLARFLNPMRRYVGEVALEKDPSIYNRLFEDGEGNQLWALWRTEGTSELSLEFDHPVEMVSWNGTISKPSKTFQIKLSNLPLYFVGSMPNIVARASKDKEISFASAPKEIDALPVPWMQDTSDWSHAAQLKLTARRNPGNGTIGNALLIATKDGLACRVSVMDSSPAENSVANLQGLWVQDSVEVFINLKPENAPAGFITDDCFHFIVTPGIKGQNARVYWTERGSKAVQHLMSDIAVAVHVEQNEYRIDFVIPWKEWIEHPPKQGDILGFDILATRSDSKGAREETAGWFGGPENNTDASLWGTIKFQPPSPTDSQEKTSN